MSMENTEAQRAINLATDLAASRQECDMLYRELSKVRDELITSKTERRVLSRWYENAKAERDKMQVAVSELEAGIKASANLVHAAETERDKLHSELVEVRSALATVSAKRDSLRTTLASWEAADTTPFLRVPDVADHVMTPVLNPVSAAVADYQDLLKRTAEAGMACSCSTHPHPPCSYCLPSDQGTPEPNQDGDFRSAIPTEQQGMTCEWWEVKDDTRNVRFWYLNGRLHSWRWSHFLTGDTHRQTLWSTEEFTKPVKPYGMTWQQLEKVLADTKSAEAPAPPGELPLCTTCHGCGGLLDQAYPSAPFPVECGNMNCDRGMTEGAVEIGHPYHEPCKSDHLVRHE
jgi:hypothetical protein